MSAREDARWTLRTWLVGDPSEGYAYVYASREAAERNGRMFAEAPDARRWEVTGPAGDVCSSWERSTGTPSEMGWVR